jgi:hypothetical protein
MVHTSSATVLQESQELQQQELQQHQPLVIIHHMSAVG